MSSSLSFQRVFIASTTLLFSVATFAAESTTSSLGAASTVSAPIPSTTEPQGRGKPTAKLSVSVNGRRIHDQFVKSNIAGPGLELSAAHEFSSKLSADLVVGALFNSGTASSLFTTEGQPSSYIYMSEATLTFAPIQPLALKGGVIETRFSTNQSIFRPSGFPGVAESVKFGGDRFNLTLQATQTMPTASGVSKNYVDSDEQPYLLLHTLGGNAGNKDDALSLSASVTHFLFSDLPANAAQDSRFVGNSVSGLGASSARFQYQFQGFEASTILRSRLSRSMKLELRTAGLRNSEAPNGKNLGYNATLIPVIDVGNMEFKPEVGYFHNESDTLPASYTSSGIGSNNRKGWLAGLRAKFKEENVTLSTRWVEANKIDANPYTADRTIFTINLETSYDIL